MRKGLVPLFLLFLLLIACSPQQTQPARINIGLDIKSGEIRTFAEKPDAEICMQDGKPVIRLFATSWCPHCQWIKDRFNQVVQEYVDAGKIVAYHWMVDLKDDDLTPQKEGNIPE